MEKSKVILNLAFQNNLNMKIVLNKCYGGFGLSHKAIMRYAELKGFKLYPFVDKKDENKSFSFKYEPYEESGEDPFLIYYSKCPLNSDGTSVDKESFSSSDIKRTDKDLVKVVKELREIANGRCASLEIINIPNDVNWEIDEYDGIESVHEKHRSW